MVTIDVKSDVASIAEAAAALVAGQLKQAIDEYGSAVWVLAGGTAPMGAYAVLARDYQTSVDWAKVTVLIGDERCVPTGHPDSNWFQISQAFLDKVPLPEANKLRPDYELPAEAAAEHYAAALSRLPTDATGIPRFDVVWLGMGEDGHTLSLFPGHPASQPTRSLVIPVHNSPKPPPDRISLTLLALTNTTNCLIMAAGAGKAGIMAQVMKPDLALPIARAVQTIETRGGQVTWLLDTAAAAEV